MICSKVLSLVSGGFLWLEFLRYGGPPRTPPERALPSNGYHGTAVNSLSVAKVHFMSEVCTTSVNPFVHNKLHTSLINLVFDSMSLRGDYQYSSAPWPMERVFDTEWLNKTEYPIQNIPLCESPGRFSDPDSERSEFTFWGFVASWDTSEVVL